MKLARVFCFLIILGSSAVATFAQTPVDPVVYTKHGGDPTCGGAPPPFSLTTNTLTLNYGTATFPFDFQNCTGSNLYQMDLVFTNVPSGTNFECFTDIWTDCTQSSVISGSFLTVTFDMFDQPITMPSSPQPCFSNDGVGANCPGFLTPNELADTTVTPTINDTPEPNSIILFGSGLLLVFVGAKLRVRART